MEKYNITEEEKDAILEDLEADKEKSKEIQESIDNIIEKNNIKEKEFKEECDHEFIKYLKGINGEKYKVEIKECVKCGGKEIINYINLEDSQTIEDVHKELKSVITW